MTAPSERAARPVRAVRDVDLLPLTEPWLATPARLLTPSAEVAEVATAFGHEAVVGDPTDRGSGLVDGALLLSGEVALAGERGATLIDAAVVATRPGGIVAVAVPSTIGARLSAAADGPSMTAAELRQLLALRGLAVELLCAPGAFARLARRPWDRTADLDHDRRPGLLDAGPVVMAVAVTPTSPAERSQRFFGSLPTKVVAASNVCLDERGRVLVVFDRFRQRWTLPGGLVDADESPADAARREAWEEAGTRVALEAIGGVFIHHHPDRLQVFYRSRPVEPDANPQPIHTHEVSAVRWVERVDAERLLDPDMRRRLAHCLEQPGGTWEW